MFIWVLKRSAKGFITSRKQKQRYGDECKLPPHKVSYNLTFISIEIPGFSSIPPYLSLEIEHARNAKCFYLEAPNPLKYQTFVLSDLKQQYENLRTAKLAVTSHGALTKV